MSRISKGTRGRKGHFKLCLDIGNKVQWKAFKEKRDIIKTVFRRVELAVAHKDIREKKIQCNVRQKERNERDE